MLSAPPSTFGLFSLALIGLAICIFADQMQTFAKYRGALANTIAGGYNRAMKIMVVNRIGAVLYNLTNAYNVDHGLPPSLLSRGLGLTIFLMGIAALLLLVWMYVDVRRTHPTIELFDVKRWPLALITATFFATAFNLLGLTIPWVAAASMPEMRLTLANTSFLFNTIFTVINVFYIEHLFARLADKRDSNIHQFVAAVIAARLLAFILVGAVLGLWI